MPTSVYVHVPFCLSRCRYCAFYSGESLEALATYPRLIETELLLAGPSDGPVATVYFGGGTPSLLGPPAVGRILEGVDRAWGLCSDAEVTLELNPASEADLRGLVAAGVNRLSVGVQALDDPILALLGRPHRAADALATLLAASRAGLEHLSADLMFGLAGLPPHLLASSVRAVAAAGATHVSTYSLELHAGTELAAAHRRGDPLLPSPEEEETQWAALDAALRAEGLSPYEVSNYSAPAKACRHNLACWNGLSYRGLGPGAHSFDARDGPWGTRTWNQPGLEDYAARLSAHRPPASGREVLSASEALLERLFLSLRRPVAFDLEAVCRRCRARPEPVRARARALADEGLLRHTGSSSWTPTPLGMRRADGMALWLAAVALPDPAIVPPDI